MIVMKNYPGIGIFSNVHNKMETHELEISTFKTIDILNFIKNTTHIGVFAFYSEVELLTLEKEVELILDDPKEDGADMSDLIKAMGLGENALDGEENEKDDEINNENEDKVNNHHDEF